MHCAKFSLAHPDSICAQGVYFGIRLSHKLLEYYQACCNDLLQEIAGQRWVDKVASKLNIILCIHRLGLRLLPLDLKATAG